MARNFVSIENRGTYTSGRKAQQYISRGLAIAIDSKTIRMLDAAELLILKSEQKKARQEFDPVTGAFNWYVGDSGGSQLMRQYTGHSGGTRGYQANHKLPKPEDTSPSQGPA